MSNNNDGSPKPAPAPPAPPPATAAVTADGPAGEIQPTEMSAKSATKIDSLDYDPDFMAQYIRFYKTGHDSPREAIKGCDADPGDSPSKKRQKKKHITPIVLEMRRTIQLCCRDNNLPLALQTFRDALRNLVRLEAQVFYQLLNLCEGTFAERTGVHVGTPKNPKKNNPSDDIERGDKNKHPPGRTISTISLEQRLHHASHIHLLLSSLNIPLIEQAYTALIRLSSRAGDFDRAEKFLDEAEQTQQCKVKLRMYSSLLRAYCGELDACNEVGGEYVSSELRPAQTQKRLIKALNLWKRMHDNSGGVSTGHPNYSNSKAGENRNETLFGEGISPKITLTECEYSAIMACATELNDAPVMERLLSDMADSVLVPGLNTIEVILKWFRSNSSITREENASALKYVTLPPREDPSLGSVTNGQGWVIYPNSTVDVRTGELSLGQPECTSEEKACSDKVKCRYRLKPVELTDAAWTAMKDMNRSIVLEGQVEGNISQYQGGGKGKKRARGSNGSNGDSQSNPRHGKNNTKNSQWRINAWRQFENFIQEHPPYNVVIDGANIGYFEQNFADAPKHIDYKQIDWIIRHLLEQQSSSCPHDQQQHIILFLHERHFSQKLIPDWANRIIQSWDGYESPYNRLTVYRTPVGMNDDWFWMHAALINGGKEGVPPVLAITNDEMRDHHFQMLAQESFLRWKERHQVHFGFGPWNKDLKRRDVFLQYPNSYSRRIQRVKCDGDDEGDAFVIPLPKKGDERRFADGLHVAEEGVPDEEMYIVIQRVRCRAKMLE
ncbi:hypothetical protein ACHAW5_005434 [Stephanodiscus triporus]|uniref:Mitochondrial ribonuclease P catalytic subunit n=1 Tax=Stephanodiscus triporus TaxID=2934178 RepID=A0ABD3P1P9_9STRA